MINGPSKNLLVTTVAEELQSGRVRVRVNFYYVPVAKRFYWLTKELYPVTEVKYRDWPPTVWFNEVGSETTEAVLTLVDEAQSSYPGLK